MRQSKKEIRRKRNVFLSAISAAFVILVLLTGWAFKERSKALLKQNEAEMASDAVHIALGKLNKSEALANEQSVKALQLKDNAEKSEQKALNAKDAAVLAKREALAAKTIAEQEKIKAEQQTLLATTETQKAEVQRKVADEAKDKALAAEQKAKKLTLLSLSQNLAFKSTQVENNTQTQSLLALQAYNFTVQNNQNVQDPVIYEALRQAIDGKGGQSNVHFMNEVRTIVLSDNDTNYMTVGKNGILSKASIESPTKLKHLPLPLKAKEIIYNVFLSPDGRKVLCSFMNGSIKVYDVADDLSSKLTNTIVEKNSLLRAASFSKKGVQYCYITEKNEIGYGNFKDNQFAILFSLPKDTLISSLVMNDEGTQIYFGTSKGSLFSLGVSTKKAEAIYMNKSSKISSLAYCSATNMLAVGLNNGEIFLVDLITNGISFEEEKHLALVENIVFNSSGTLLASASADKTIRVFDLQKKYAKPIILRNQNEKIRSVIFTTDDKLIAGGASKALWYWELSSSKLAAKICEKLKRNFGLEEWEQYVGKEIEYQKTCENLDVKK